MKMKSLCIFSPYALLILCGLVGWTHSHPAVISDIVDPAVRNFDVKNPKNLIPDIKGGYTADPLSKMPKIPDINGGHTADPSSNMPKIIDIKGGHTADPASKMPKSFGQETTGGTAKTNENFKSLAGDDAKGIQTYKATQPKTSAQGEKTTFVQKIRSFFLSLNGRVKVWKDKIKQWFSKANFFKSNEVKPNNPDKKSPTEMFESHIPQKSIVAKPAKETPEDSSVHVQNTGKERLQDIGKERPKNIGKEGLQDIRKETLQKIGKERLQDIGKERPKNIGREGLQDIRKETLQKIGKERLQDIGKERPKNIGKEGLQDNGKESLRNIGKERPLHSPNIKDLQVDSEVLTPDIKGGNYLENIRKEYEANPVQEVPSKVYLNQGKPSVKIQELSEETPKKELIHKEEIPSITKAQGNKAAGGEKTKVEPLQEATKGKLPSTNSKGGENTSGPKSAASVSQLENTQGQGPSKGAKVVLFNDEAEGSIRSLEDISKRHDFNLGGVKKSLSQEEKENLSIQRELISPLTSTREDYLNTLGKTKKSMESLRDRYSTALNEIRQTLQGGTTKTGPRLSQEEVRVLERGKKILDSAVTRYTKSIDDIEGIRNEADKNPKLYEGQTYGDRMSVGQQFNDAFKDYIKT